MRKKYNLTPGRDYILTSLGYPFFYTDNLNCKMEITAPKGLKILLEFSLINFEYCNDYMKVQCAIFFTSEIENIVVM